MHYSNPFVTGGQKKNTHTPPCTGRGCVIGNKNGGVQLGLAFVLRGKNTPFLRTSVHFASMIVNLLLKVEYFGTLLIIIKKRKNCPITITYSGALSWYSHGFYRLCSLPPPLAFTFDLPPKSDDVVLFYFIYLHMSKSHLHMSKSLFSYLPLLQTTVYVPHPRTELLWRHFIKIDVTGHFMLLSHLTFSF
jgi:hypothetical protein